jgi:hypothetical protein
MSSGIKFKCLMAAALMIAACCLPAFAADDASKTAVAWDLKQLMSELSQIKTAKALTRGAQILKRAQGAARVLRHALYTAPSRLEKITSTAEAGKPGSRAGQTHHRTGRGQRRTLTLQDYPEIWAFVESIRATLAGDLETLSRFYQTSLEGDAERWQLALQPNEQKMRAMVSLIKISGHKNWVDSIEIQEADGDHSLMTVVKDGS